MITKNVELLDITDKLNYVKDCKITQQSFYFHMYSGIRRGNMFTYGSYDNDKMTGCMVLSLNRDLKNTILTLIFIWTDKNYPKLWKEYLEFASEIAKEKGANKLQINTSRNPKAILRKYGKYGFSQKYVIFEKDVK